MNNIDDEILLEIKVEDKKGEIKGKDDDDDDDDDDNDDDIDADVFNNEDVVIVDIIKVEFSTKHLNGLSQSHTSGQPAKQLRSGAAFQ